MTLLYHGQDPPDASTFSFFASAPQVLHSLSWIQSFAPGPHTHRCPSVSYQGLLLQGWHEPSELMHMTLLYHGQDPPDASTFSFFASAPQVLHSLWWIQSFAPGPHTHRCPSVSYQGLLLQGWHEPSE